MTTDTMHGFAREDLEAIADGLDGYERTVNVGNVAGTGDHLLESTTAAAARFIRAALADRAERAAPAWVLVSDRLPEPGKAVLLDIGRKTPIRAIWAAQHTVEAGDECPDDWAEYVEADDIYYCPAGWYEWNEHEETHWAVSATARAWMELPAQLPSSGAEGSGNG